MCGHTSTIMSSSALGQVRKCKNAQVRWNNENRKTIAQQIVVSVEGQGGVTLSYALTATDFRLKTTPGGFLHGTERRNATDDVADSTLGRLRTESWSYKIARTAKKHKSFEHTLRRKESVTP